jgi:hypothetical protein
MPSIALHPDFALHLLIRDSRRLRITLLPSYRQEAGMPMFRLIGTGCLALAAIYTVSLAFWWPRAEELASIAMSPPGNWLHRLLALKLISDALLVVPTAFEGLRCMWGGGSHSSVGRIVAVGLLASMGPLVSYLTTALPLYLTEGAWLRFGPQNDFGVGMALATLALQLMLLAVLLRGGAFSETETVAVSQ